MAPENTDRPYSRLDPEISEQFQTPELPQPKKTHRAIEYVLFGMFALLLALAGLALYATYSPRYKVVPNRLAEGIKGDRVNILFIGIGGESHKGGGKDLADSIMLVSLKPSTKQVAVISVPRDLYLKIGRYGRHRINRAHVIGGQTNYPGGGPKLTMDTVSEVFDQPIHVFVRLDFTAFEKIIDDLGGVEIFVKQGFHDFLFDDGFKPGWQHMNGDRALRYARYRYIIGDEGDNFAREARQQQVINAVKQKIRKQGGEDVIQLIKTVRTLSKHTDTNLTTAQMLWLYRNFKSVRDEEVRYIVLKPYMEVFDLRSFTDAGEAVRPRGGDYRMLQQLARSVFDEGHPATKKVQVAVTPAASPTAAHVAGK